MGRLTGRNRIGSGIRRGAAVLALAALTACAPTLEYHGYTPSDEVLSQIAVGRDTRESVLAAVGRPTAGGVLDQTGYYYVKSTFRQSGFLAPEEIQREVLAISFAPQGTVSNIERFGLEDGRAVALSRRVTDSTVEGGTFLRQLIGAAGNFDAAGVLGGDE